MNKYLIHVDTSAHSVNPLRWSWGEEHRFCSCNKWIKLALENRLRLLKFKIVSSFPPLTVFSNAFNNMLNNRFKERKQRLQKGVCFRAYLCKVYIEKGMVKIYIFLSNVTVANHGQLLSPVSSWHGYLELSNWSHCAKTLREAKWQLTIDLLSLSSYTFTNRPHPLPKVLR